MITKPQCQKYFESAQKRFLYASIQQFFALEFPRTFGPYIIDKIAHRLVELVDQQLPRQDHLRPGQIVWNAVSRETRPDSSKLKLVPVILTLVDPNDIQQLIAGKPMSEIAQNALARVAKEAFQQGALLSMRDIGLMVWRVPCSVTTMRQRWENLHNEILPHPGSIQDFGSCITHKVSIIRKAIYEKKDPRVVANETKHSQRAVDRYLKDFNRVRTCYQHNKDLDFISKATGLSNYLVRQYLAIIHEYEKEEHVTQNN